ncbi:hypothetical protein [Dendrosporobacter sp. 1207_IL3150]|uniref:hypothetical protein n=1 Tax=Dendrosporobacter sp. 1207_IL3150 TaxID=3084054 RepID=UPI002FDAD561
MDILAQPLHLVTEAMDKLSYRYTVKISRPTRDFFKVEGDALYVIRQRLDADGQYQIVAAAKMGKEVF